MSVFEDLRNGKPYDIRDEVYLKEAHGEMDRCRRLPGCRRLHVP